MAKKTNIKELSRRYTTAIYELAKANGKIDEVEKNLTSLVSLLDENEKLQKFMASPIASEAEQIEAVKELGKSQKFSALTTNLLLTVAKNGRLKNLKDIVEAFQEQIAEDKGELKAEIISAQALSTKQTQAIAKDLSAKTGKTIRVVESVKPEIIGGLIVKIGSQMFDFSVKSRLNKLKNKLKAAS